jgi:hypothetical protein
MWSGDRGWEVKFSDFTPSVFDAFLHSMKPLNELYDHSALLVRYMCVNYHDNISRNGSLEVEERAVCGVRSSSGSSTSTEDSCPYHVHLHESQVSPA